MLDTINYKIFLGSKSPRRQELLKNLGFDFEIFTIETEEIFPSDLKKEEVTNHLAKLKAKAYEGQLAENELVITADTIVWHNDTVLGKPKNEKEAFDILKSLSGDSHRVYTSVCIKSKVKEVVFSDCTTVFFSALSDEEINYYITNYKPFDKAGTYGIQDWIGLRAITKIEGSYYNVMGLPTEKLYKALLQF